MYSNVRDLHWIKISPDWGRGSREFHVIVNLMFLIYVSNFFFFKTTNDELTNEQKQQNNQNKFELTKHVQNK
jgi:hypothetical protein